MNDTIRREDAIKAIRHWFEIIKLNPDILIDAIIALPSADKSGEWLEKEVVYPIDGIPPIEEWQSARCSKCGKYHTTPYMYYFDNYKFCP